MLTNLIIMGYTESFSIPIGDLKQVLAYLEQCRKEGRAKSEVILTALKKQMREEQQPQ
jgi:hypothetical protein